MQYTLAGGFMTVHHENLPIQYTDIFSAEKIENSIIKI